MTDLYNLLENGFAYMAMTNYPSEANFLQHMPAWPCTVACDRVQQIDPKTSESEKNIFTRLMDSINSFFGLETI